MTKQIPELPIDKKISGILGSEATKYLTLLLSHIPSLIYVIDDQGKVLFYSDHFKKFHNVVDEPQVETDLFPLVIHDRLKRLQVFENAQTEDYAWELSIKHFDGSQHVYEMQRMPFITDKGKSVNFTLGADITDHKLAERHLRDYKSQINYLAFHDPLTGLPNRSLLYDRLNKSLSRAKRSNGHFALLLIDLDRFKTVNDNFGREAGDAFLKAVGQNLKEVLRDTDTVARMGSDEFAVVLDNIHKAEDIDGIAHKILEATAKPIRIQERDVSCTVSIGISLFPKDGVASDQLLRYADLAMYKAKLAGKNRHQYFVEAMTSTAVNYLLLENDLRKAIEEKEFILYYQPQIELQSKRIVGLEALVRWQHPERGLVPPAHFIPLAEETGLIEQIGEWVLREACHKFRLWLNQGLNFGCIAVNLSARQFRHDDFGQKVLDILNEVKLAPECLELELTESIAMENAGEAIDVLQRLSKMGLSLAIDDFGTGYSSLAYLKRFPIQKLKVDKSFIKDIDSNSNDSAIAKSIIDLAHNMSLQVIAEGVERDAQSQWLCERGCDQVQGFYYSKPLSEQDLIRCVRDPKCVTVDANGLTIISEMK